MGKRKTSNREDAETSKELQKKSKIARKGEFENFYNMLSKIPSKISFRVVDGVRYMDPYWSAYGCFTKGRWIGREVSEVLLSEFLANKKNYPKAAIRMGRVFINEKQITDPSYRLKSNDRVIHLGHRHEHPILAEPEIKILVNNDKWFVVNKPPSMPVHACGQYFFHSVIGLLRTMHKITDLKICHRLDRTTSGVLIFAKDHNTDLEFKNLLDNNQLKKEYICKVEGIFPSEEVECNAPIGVLSPQMGIQCIKPDGKRAVSRFTRLHANESENTSIVSCRIETGRTHQIRVHLQYLGHPIIADRLYNNSVWGPNKGKSAVYGKSLEKLKMAVHDCHESSAWHEKENPQYEKLLEKIANNTMQQPDKIDLEELCMDELPITDTICLGCNVTKKIPSMDDFSLKLHCWRYESDQWKFEAPLPEWARYDGDNQHEQPEEFLICPEYVSISS